MNQSSGRRASLRRFSSFMEERKPPSCPPLLSFCSHSLKTESTPQPPSFLTVSPPARLLVGKGVREWLTVRHTRQVWVSMNEELWEARRERDQLAQRLAEAEEELTRLRAALNPKP